MPLGQDAILLRLVSIVLGIIGAVGFYFVIEVFDTVLTASAARWGLATLLLGTSAVAMVLCGPLAPRRAVVLAVLCGLAAAILAALYGSRFDGADRFGTSAAGLFSLIAILALGAPFVMAAAAHPRGWRESARLFDLAWEMVVRVAGALLFLGLFWAILGLSHLLLKPVGIDIFDWFERWAFLGYALSGAVFGLAMAVVHELRDYITPYVFVRLARFLLPIVTGVTALFVVAFVLVGSQRGHLGFSPTMTVLLMMALATGLISAVMDRDDAEASQNLFLRRTAQVQSLILPMLAAIALYSVWVRVAQYGWTPARVTAAIGAGYAVLYGASYGAAAVFALRRGGRGWMARLRAVNTGLALAVIAGLALSLTPLLNAQAISARAQEARIWAVYERTGEFGDQQKADQEGAARLALFDLKDKFGAAGRAGLARLEARAKAEGAEALLADIGRLDSLSRYYLKRPSRDDAARRSFEELLAVTPILPDGAQLPEGLTFDTSPRRSIDFYKSCKRTLKNGYRGCALLVLDKEDFEGQHYAVMISAYPPSLFWLQIDARNVLKVRSWSNYGTSAAGDVLRISDLIAAAHEGRFQIAPPRRNALHIGDVVLMPNGEDLRAMRMLAE